MGLLHSGQVCRYCEQNMQIATWPQPSSTVSIGRSKHILQHFVSSIASSSSSLVFGFTATVLALLLSSFSSPSPLLFPFFFFFGFFFFFFFISLPSFLVFF